MSKHFILALDCGTTSVKALLADAEGQVIVTTRNPIASHFPSPGRVEQDAEKLFHNCITTIQQALADAAISPQDVGALGITTQRASIVVFDRATGEPLAPMVIWSDVRGLDRAAELQNAGFMVWPQTPAAKLESVLAQIPDAHARAARGEILFGTLDTYLAYRLSDGAIFATDISSAWASGFSDYFQAGGVWNEGLLEHQGIPVRMLPKLCDSVGAFGTTSAKILGAEIPMTAIIADQQAGLFGHAALEHGGWKASFGTSAVVIAATGEMPGSPHHTMPPQALMRYAGTTKYCVEGMVITAGVLLEWLCQEMGLFHSPAALAQAGGHSASNGVVIRPSLQGLGAPHGRFAARGVIAGISPNTDRNAIARAALEGIAVRTHEIITLMREAELGGDYLPIDGGLTCSDAFCQILADICQIPIRRHQVRDGAAFGAMVAAGLGAGIFTRAALPNLARYEEDFAPQISKDAAQALISAWRETLKDAAS